MCHNFMSQCRRQQTLTECVRRQHDAQRINMSTQLHLTIKTGARAACLQFLQTCCAQTVCNFYYLKRLHAVCAHRLCATFTTCVMNTQYAEYEWQYACGACNSYYEGCNVDRVCMPIPECKPGHYSILPTAEYSKPTCMPSTRCAMEEYQILPSTLLTDGECTPLTVCTPLFEYEQQPPDTDVTGMFVSDRICTSASKCILHLQYEVAQPTTSTDRLCDTLTT